VVTISVHAGGHPAECCLIALKEMSVGVGCTQLSEGLKIGEFNNLFSVDDIKRIVCYLNVRLLFSDIKLIICNLNVK